MAAWTLGFNAKGPQGVAGNSIQIVSGAPASSVGSNGDIAIDTTTSGGPYLYGKKANGSWPTSGQSLAGAAGAAGNLWYYGTAVPGQQFQKNIGDLYLQTTSGNVYQYTSTGWSQIANILGAAGTNGTNGTNGLSVLSGSGAPASSLGVQGQPAYLDTTAGALYGAKGASAWPSSPLSLVGAQGLSVLSGSGAPASSLGVSGQPGYIDTTNGILYPAKGSSSWPSGVSLNGFSIRNGSGAPTTIKPTVQFDGDFYVDTSANVIYGPRASGSWPSSGVSFAGNTFRTGQGAPASSLGAIGDLYVDGTSGAGTLYQKSSSGWATTGGSLLGPGGSIGPQGYSSLTTQAAGLGPQVQSYNQTLTSTAQTMQAASSTLPGYVLFAQGSAFLGASAVNNGVACVISLVDTTTNQAVWTSSSIAAGSNFTTGTFSATSYPLVANRVYQFMITGSGTSNIMLNPCFLQPSMVATQGGGILQGFTSPANITLSSTPQYFYVGNQMSTSNSKSLQYTPLRTGALLGATALYVPSASGAASATATFSWYYYVQNGGSTGSSASFTAANDALPHATQLSTALSLTTGVNYFCAVTGSGTGTVDIKFQLAV